MMPPLPCLDSKISRKQIWSLGLGALALAQFLFVAAYIGAERAIYFWDHSMYHAMAKIWLGVEGFGNFLSHFWRSFEGDYNLVFAIPSLLTFSLFGEGRPVFILTNFVFFFLAYEIALAVVLRRVFDVSWRGALLGAGVACSLQPSLWRPLVEGFPDLAAAASLVFALGFVLGPDRGKKAALKTGFCLGLAVLLRRHFVYAAFAVLFVESIWTSRFWRTARQDFWQRIVFLAVAAGSATLFLCVMEFSYVVKAFTTDYRALYKSYESSAGDFFLFVARAVGWFWVMVTGAGFVGAWVVFPARRSALGFVLAFGFVSLLLWSAGPSQASMHYLLHEIYVLGGVGMVGLFLALAQKGRGRGVRWGVGAVIAALLVVNSMWALWLAPEGDKPNTKEVPAFWAAPRPPLVRPDYDQLVALGRYLVETTSPRDHIVVVGSSFYLNQDLLRAIFVEILDRPDMVARILFAPEVDHGQAPPFTHLANGTVFVVPDQVQYHLEPQGQKVVTALAQFFPPQGTYADVFHADDAHFTLDTDIGLTIWRRGVWPPALLSSSMHAIRGIAGGFQSWVPLKSGFNTVIQTKPAGTTDLVTGFMAGRDPLELLFVPPLDAGRYQMSFVFQTGDACRDPRLALRLFDGKGKELLVKSLPRLWNSPVIERSFEVPFVAEEKVFLRLDIEAQPPVPCGFSVQELQLIRL